MKQEKQNKGIYRAPAMTVVELECETMLAMSGDVTVCGWGDGVSLEGGEAEESVSRCRKWGNLWSNN